MHMNSTVGHDDTNSMEPQFVLMIEKKHLNHALGDLSPQRGSLERDVSHNSRKFRSVYIYIYVVALGYILIPMCFYFTKFY